MKVTEKLLQLFQFPNVACQNTYPHSGRHGRNGYGWGGGKHWAEKLTYQRTVFKLRKKYFWICSLPW